MANIEIYNKFFKYDSVEKINKAFTSSLLTTNRTYDFFVNWKKIKQNVDKYKKEIGLLSSLVGSKNFEKELKETLLEYPKTANVIPLLVAIRDKKFDVLKNLDEGELINIDLSQNLDDKSIVKLVDFAKNSGIEDLFQIIKVLSDYIYGVEVGLDSNARKNRSGTFMESVIADELDKIQSTIDNLIIFPKSTFSKLEEHGVKIPNGLKDRTPDFSIKKDNTLFSIEVNFYSGQGSKPQEIVDSYINRQRELKKSNWNFIWITDGSGWRGGQNQILKGFHNIDYVMNINFVKKGFLAYILNL
jgi:type II restriction enzyme